jgi:hypothetical protein
VGITSVTVLTPPDNITYPDGVDGIIRPAWDMEWVNDGSGGGPYDVLHEWDTDSGFPAPISDSNTGISGTSDRGIPPSDLGPEGTTWYYRVKVTDTADAGNLTSTTRTIDWKNYNDGTNIARHLYQLANIGVNFIAGVDGDPQDFARYLYQLANVGVNFITGVDGAPIDQPRYLYQLANLIDDTPTPHIWYIAPEIQETGNSITITGTGFGTDQTTYTSEVRLYDSVGTGGSFVTMSPSAWTDTELTVTVPGGASTGYVTVVHTAPTPDLFSNQKLLTVTITPADPEAGWWAVISNLRNSSNILSPLPNIAGQSIEYLSIDQDVGNGKLILHQAHPDLDTIVDPTASPPVSSLVKVYENGRYSYSFYAEDRSNPYSEDEATKVALFGEGIESCLKWGGVLPYDHPANPSKFPNWIWGSTDNLLSNPNFDDGDGNPIENPTGADGNDDDGNAVGWSTRGGADITAINNSTNAYTGDWYLEIDPNGSVHAGGTQTFTVQPNTIYKFNARVKESTAAGMRITMAVSGEDEGATDTGTYANLFSFNGEWLCELDNVARNPAANGCPGGASDGTWQTLDVEIKTGSAQTSMTVTVQADHHAVCGGPGNLVFWLGELIGSGFGIDLEPWIALDIPNHATDSFVIDTSVTISGKPTVKISPTAKIAGVYQTVDVAAGGRYTITIQATTSATPAVDDTWALQANTGAGFIIDTFSQVPTGGGTTDKWTLSFDVPAGVERVSFLFFYSGPNDPAAINATLATFAPGDPISTPGVILNAVIDRMQARQTASAPAALEFLQRSFTATTDSNGDPWSSAIALELRPSDDLFQVVQRIQATGFQWEVQPVNFRAGGDSGIELSVYNDLGKGTNFEFDRTGPAILPSDSAISGRMRKGTQGVNYVYVEGQDGIWSSADSGDANMTSLERREEWVTNTRARDTTTTGQIAVTRLEDHEEKGFSFRLDISQNDDIRPNLDFLNGDTIRVAIPDDVPDGFYRAKSVTGTLTGEGTDMRHSVDFNRIEFEEAAARDRALKRALELLGSENVSLGTGLVSDLPASGGGSTGGGTTVIGGSASSTKVATHTHDLVDDITGRATIGDITGSVPGPLTVQGLRGRSVASDAPANLDALVWNSGLGRWEPVDLVVTRTKTADESVASSTTLQDDDALIFPIGADEIWIMDAYLVTDGVVGGDIKVHVNGPSGVAGIFSVVGPGTTATTSEDATVNNQLSVVGGGTGLSAGTLGVGVSALVEVHAVIRNGATAGNVVIQWAQNSSDGTATRVLIDSYLKAVKQ